ncbi:MAG: PA0069 family radical SAM protein [Phycisphaeraceae bacterium]|nr:MAG: PA0069 family radical SAM protein [Phycisphaeraceae bacterium]
MHGSSRNPRDTDDHPDGMVAPHHALGRGATINPTGRYERVTLTIDGDALDAELRERGQGKRLSTTIRADRAKTIINRVDSPDIHFNWTINPYRGCEHGCFYCYARPGHEYLGLSPGIDFESILFAKHDAARLLRRELSDPKWRPETIVLSGVTDPYQPIERDLGITRGVLEVLAECCHPVSIITKSSLILRDLDLLRELHATGSVHVAVSLTTLDNRLASVMEPRASSPRSRLDTIRTIAGLGIPVTVMVAPIIPAINDHEVAQILEAAAEAGAHNAAYILLRLPHQNKSIYTAWLQAHFPDRAAKAESLLRQCRDGEMSSSEFGERFVGTGPVADQIRQSFRLFARRYGLDRPSPPHNQGAFRPPQMDAQGQISLF